jgi:hypothetical protein
MNQLSTTAIAADGAVKGAVRLWLRAEGLAVLILSLELYHLTAASWWRFFVFLLVPDLSLLAYVVEPAFAARVYNIVHSYTLPIALAVVALAVNQSHVLPYAIIWTAHIGMDRALGFGLKYPEAFGRTHLGVLGKTAPTTD